MENKTEIGFELFEHTADIGLRVYGDELVDLFENAARGMYSIIFHGSPPDINEVGEYNIKLQASDLEQLLVDWLDELLFIFSTEQIVCSKFLITLDSNKFTLNATIAGEVVSDESLSGICEIKAVTYHMLSLKKNNHWQAQIIFDI